MVKDWIRRIRIVSMVLGLLIEEGDSLMVMMMDMVT